MDKLFWKVCLGFCGDLCSWGVSNGKFLIVWVWIIVVVPALFLVYLFAQKVDQIMYGIHGVGKLLKTSCCCQKAGKKSNKNWYFFIENYILPK